MDTVSVIIPLYKSEAYIRRALDSVLAQTHQDFEIICVDDCSPDGTADIVREYAQKDARVRYILHEKNMGAPAFGRNTGLAAATGEYVTFLDHDDTFLPAKLETLLGAMKREEVDFVCSNCFLINDATGKVDLQAWGTVTGDSKKGFAKRLLRDNFVPPNSTLIRRSILERTGFFDAGLRGVDDFDLWYRIARIAPATVVNEPLCTWRYRNDASISADQSLMLRDEVIFYEKIAGLPDATAEEVAIARDHIRRDTVRLANRFLLKREYGAAAKAYARAGKAGFSMAARFLPWPFRMAYAVKLGRVPEFQPLDLDFNL